MTLDVRTMSVQAQLWAWKSYCVFILAPLLLSPLVIALGSKESYCAFVILLMAVYWISECLPVGVTSLLPIVFFPFFGIMSTEAIATEYMNNINALMFGGLMVATAIEYWNIHKRVALRVLTLVGSEPRWVMLGMMLSTWFMSMWISNTASTAMMVPVTKAVLEELRKSDNYDDPDFNPVQSQDGGNVDGDGQSVTIKCSQDKTKNILYEDRSSGLDDETQKPSDNIKDPQTDIPCRKESRSQDIHYSNMAKGMLLSICYAANCGGIASLTGTGPNLILKLHIDKLYESNRLPSPVSFGVWMSFGLPISLVILLISWCWLQILFLRCGGLCTCCRKKSSRYEENKKNLSTIIRKQYNTLGPLVCGQVMIGVLFVCMVVLWSTRDMGGVAGWGHFFEPQVKDGTSAILVCVLVFALPSTLPFLKSYPNYSHPETDPIYGRVEGGVQPVKDNEIQIRPLIQWKIASQRFPWALLFFIGGGVAISAGCDESGLSLWIGNKLTYFQDWNEYGILFIICAICTTTTEFASNAAMASILMPILQRLALSTQVHPLKYMLPGCLACSFAYMLPVATPPNAIVFNTGMFKMTDFMKAGIVMNILTILVLIAMIVSLGPVVYDIDHIPQQFINMTSSDAVTV